MGRLLRYVFTGMLVVSLSQVSTASAGLNNTARGVLIGVGVATAIVATGAILSSRDRRAIEGVDGQLFIDYESGYIPFEGERRGYMSFTPGIVPGYSHCRRIETFIRDQWGRPLRYGPPQFMCYDRYGRLVAVNRLAFRPTVAVRIMGQSSVVSEGMILPPRGASYGPVVSVGLILAPRRVAPFAPYTPYYGYGAPLPPTNYYDGAVILAPQPRPLPPPILPPVPRGAFR